jgi:hypothetical protein
MASTYLSPQYDDDKLNLSQATESFPFLQYDECSIHKNQKFFFILPWRLFKTGIIPLHLHYYGS